jgi:hypothetical protein
MGLSSASKSPGRAANQGTQTGAGSARRSVSGHAQVARLDWFHDAAPVRLDAQSMLARMAKRKLWVKPPWDQEALTQIAEKDSDGLVKVAAKLALDGVRDGK